MIRPVSSEQGAGGLAVAPSVGVRPAAVRDPVRLVLPGAAAADGLSLEIGPLTDAQALAGEWQALEPHTAASFFTSWTWISCWLQHLEEPLSRLLVLRVRHGGQTVGLGLWGRRTLRRLRLLPSRALLLHATGRPEFDDLSAEHNALLCRADLAPQIEAAVYPALLTQCRGVGQVVVPRASAVPPSLPAFSAAAGLRLRIGSELAYRVGFDPTAPGGARYLDTLGAATRATVRRSTRLYEALGPLRLDVAGSTDEALQFLGRLKYWHQRYWQSRGLPGAFANPRFEVFHRRLIAAGFGHGHIRLLRLSAGSQELGLLYAFVHRGQMLAYQSGLCFDAVARNHHPGLVLHAMAVQRAIDEGLSCYDLMAGEARYKQQLATQCYPMLTYSLHRPGPALWLEEAWRRLKALAVGHGVGRRGG